MNRIVLQYSNEFNIYNLLKWTSKSLGTLGLFLTDMSFQHFSTYTEWAQNPLKFRFEGNNMLLEKKDYNIFISSLFADDPTNDEPLFKISIPKFVQAIKQWEIVLQLKPEKIIITEKNGIITIEAT